MFFTNLPSHDIKTILLLHDKNTPIFSLNIFSGLHLAISLDVFFCNDIVYHHNSIYYLIQLQCATLNIDNESEN